MHSPIKEPLNPALDARAFWVAYIKEVHVIWPIPHEHINKYEVYRDGVLVNEFDQVKEGPPEGEDNHPVFYDHDHHTNLFWKDSLHKVWYRDGDVQDHQRYTYVVKAYKIEEDETILEEITSLPMEVLTT